MAGLFKGDISALSDNATNIRTAVAKNPSKIPPKTQIR